MRRRESEEMGGQRKGVPRNILTSPWIPSCVLNHFPVDSAVCNPIIGISPSGKLLFYSRTTQVPNVPCTTIFSLFLSLRLLPFYPLHSFPASIQVDFNSTGAREFFFPTASHIASPNPASEFVYFALLNLIVVNSTSSGFRKPVGTGSKAEWVQWK